MSTMTNRERFFKTMKYENVDRRPLRLAGYWQDTLSRWYKEGLPDVCKTTEDVRKHLGVDDQVLKMINVTGIAGPFPSFERKIVSEDDTFRDSIDHYGRTIREFKDHSSMPEWLEFPVKTPEDLKWYLDHHFDVENMSDRFDDAWEKRIDIAKQEEDAIILIDGGCYYWTLRSIAGVENASYLLYDAPELVQELFDRYYAVVEEGIKRVSQKIKIDCVGFGEDLAFKTGLLISKDMFRQMILPIYKKVMDLAHSHGIEWTSYDSDGNLRELIPDYLSVGINCTGPTEVAANMVPVELRRDFGKEMRYFGGIDKREIAKGKKEIDAEIERNRPLIEEGGFFPYIDHSVSADISWNNYQYYVEKMIKALEI